VKFSTGVPNCREGRLNPIGSVDPAWMSDVAQAAEQLGYYSLWLNEFLETEPNVRVRFDDPPNYYDALTTLGYLAAQTRRIRFLPSVLVLPLHHPILLNRQAATLDVLSGGRLTLGVGLGGSREDYRRLRGELGAVNRGQMMDEFVQALRALWTEEKASFSGRFVDFRDVHCFPKPRQNPLPLFMAGEADAVLRRIGRFAQGWIDSFSPPDSMRQIIGQLRNYTREARGADAPVEIARQFYISLAETREAAQANLAASLPNAKPTPATRRREGAEAMLIGTPAEIAARLRDYAAIGVTEICAIFYSPNAAGALQQMQSFARDVIPAVT
jgi:probable F420-dependent oxidoreductase